MYLDADGNVFDMEAFLNMRKSYENLFAETADPNPLDKPYENNPLDTEETRLTMDIVDHGPTMESQSKRPKSAVVGRSTRSSKKHLMKNKLKAKVGHYDDMDS